MFCAWIFARRNICGKLPKAVGFVIFIVCSLLPPISLSGLVRIWSGHILTQSHTSSIHSSTWQTLKLDGGSAQPPERSKCTPQHPHSLPQLHSDLDFWIQKVKLLENSTSCISTTSRYLLVWKREKPMGYDHEGSQEIRVMRDSTVVLKRANKFRQISTKFPCLIQLEEGGRVESLILEDMPSQSKVGRFLGCVTFVDS